MPDELYVYTGSGWDPAINFYIYTGATWSPVNEAYVYDGTGWDQFWPSTAVYPSLVSVTSDIGRGDYPDNDCASINKCHRCISWEAADASETTEHIRILVSVAGGTYGEAIDDRDIEFPCAERIPDGDGDCDECTRNSGTGSDLKGCYCAGCTPDGTSTQHKVRLETDGGDVLAGPTSCELTGTLHSTCGEGS